MAFDNIVRRGPLSLFAGANLVQGNLVKLDGSGNVVVTTSGDVPLGVVAETGAINTSVAIEPFEGVSELVAGGAIAIGNYVKCGTSGKVVVETSATTPTALTIGQAATATNGDTEKIYIASLR